MARLSFFCIDGHTCGNPVRVVTGGSIPQLRGATMFERRQHFLAEFDFIRTGLMFEPRGHDMMSGAILYPPTRAGLRRRHPLHRDLRLPADVRPRHHRHGHDRAGERADPAAPTGRAASRHAGGPRRSALRAERPACRERAHHQRALVPLRRGLRGRGRGPRRGPRRRRLWRQLLCDRRQTAGLFRRRRRQPVRSPALESEAARRVQRALRDRAS